MPFVKWCFFIICKNLVYTSLFELIVNQLFVNRFYDLGIHKWFDGANTDLGVELGCIWVIVRRFFLLNRLVMRFLILNCNLWWLRGHHSSFLPVGCKYWGSMMFHTGFSSNIVWSRLINFGTWGHLFLLLMNDVVWLICLNWFVKLWWIFPILKLWIIIFFSVGLIILLYCSLILTLSNIWKIRFSRPISIGSSASKASSWEISFLLFGITSSWVL